MSAHHKQRDRSHFIDSWDHMAIHHEATVKHMVSYDTATRRLVDLIKEIHKIYPTAIRRLSDGDPSKSMSFEVPT